MEKFGIPCLFGALLQENPVALRHFTALTNEAKQQVIDETKNIKSKGEMEEYIRKI